MKKISLLGSTGSIGRFTLDVVAQNPEEFSVVAMACGRNWELFAEQVLRFRPQLISLNDEADLPQLRERLKDFRPEIILGMEGAVAVATHSEADHVLSAIVGAAGLQPTLAAIRVGKEIGLANKETMVVAGAFMNVEAKSAGVRILPVDSEHSAIFQCLNGESKQELRRMILTASGGPFLHKSREDFASITVAEALKHPNWSMGSKISIDSATLMNKGLELVEARWLFDVPPDQLDVLVHPQSIIHSMVEFQDGSVMAQLGIPDMRIPIAYALSYPRRLPNALPPLDLAKIGQLVFLKPDEEKFRCLALAKEVLRGPGSLAPVLNAANEVAVAEFLAGKIGFPEIAHVVENTLQAHNAFHPQSLEEILDTDQWARRHAQQCVAA